MNSIVAHLISGRILFTGLGLLALVVIVDSVIDGGGVITDKRQSHRYWHITIFPAWCCEILAISTAALPVWSIGVLIGGLVPWTVVRVIDAKSLVRRAAGDLLILISLTILAWELPRTQMGVVRPVGTRAIVVLGDSLSAGLDEGEGTPWPVQLGKLHSVAVKNLAEAGATTRDGIRMVRRAHSFPGLVIVELGGNDMLGERPLSDFEADLSRILGILHDQDRSVVLVELPLLPGKNAWGVAQRRLARKYGCAILPKRELVDVLASPQATVDTLHLTGIGHQRMAEVVWRACGSALPLSPEGAPAIAEAAAPAPYASMNGLTPTTSEKPPAEPATARKSATVPSIDELILFQPSRTGNWSPAQLHHQNVEFAAADGTKLHGWYCAADTPRAVVLFCHGNGGNISWMASYLEFLRRVHRLSILAFDYRGYGKSQGLPTVEGVVSDGLAARTKLSELAGVPTGDLVIWGQSMGGAVAVQLAADAPPRGLVLQSTFDSFHSVAKHHAPHWAFLVRPNRFDSVSRIREVSCPLLMIHGTADRVVPYPMGQTLFAAAAEPKQFVTIPGIDHNSPVPDSVYLSIDQFLDAYGSKRP